MSVDKENNKEEEELNNIASSFVLRLKKERRNEVGNVSDDLNNF